MVRDAKLTGAGSQTSAEEPMYLPLKWLYPILFVIAIAQPFSIQLSGVIGLQAGYWFVTGYFPSGEFWSIMFPTVTLGVAAICQLLMFLAVHLVLKSASRKWGKEI